MNLLYYKAGGIVLSIAISTLIALIMNWLVLSSAQGDRAKLLFMLVMCGAFLVFFYVGLLRLFGVPEVAFITNLLNRMRGVFKHTQPTNA